MKLLALILPALWFLYHTSSPGTFRPYHNYNYVDTPIVGLVMPDQNEQDTNTLPPPDTLPIPPSGPRHDLIFEELYNDATIDSKILGFNYPSGGGCCSYSHTISDSFDFEGGFSLRTELFKTDATIGASRRSELNYPSNGEPLLNFERWFGFAVYFPTWYAKDRAPDLFFQLHAADNLSPPVALWTQNDIIYYAYNGGSLQSYGTVPKGSWQVFVIHVIWDTDPANNGAAEGLIEIWMNDVKLTQQTGKNSPAGLAKGPYPKWGIYKWPWKDGSTTTSDITHRVLYIDDTRYGTGLSDYASVRP